jgi:tetratricopeptide (TPR) repeat protein
MPEPQNLKKKGISLSRALVPLITLGVLVFLWRYNLKWMTLPVIGFLVFYYMILPKLVRAQVNQFHRKAIILLTTGKAEEVLRLVKRSILLQLFAPSASIDAKLGLAYAQTEAYDRAASCFDNAIPAAPASERTALQTGLAKALLATGDLARAEAEGQAILYRVTRLPELLAVVARARVGLGKIDDETKRLLDEAEKQARTDDEMIMVTLTRIEAALTSGRKPPELPEGADSNQRLLRAWIHLVRGLLRDRREDAEKAKQSFKKAAELMPSSFISKIAIERLETLTGDDASKESQPGRDPAIQRKRRRRR